MPAAAFMFALARFVMEFPVASTSMVLLVKVSVEEAVVFASSCVCMALVTPSKYPNSVLVTVPSWIKAASKRLLVVRRDCLEEREAVRPLMSVMSKSSVVMVACFASSAACNPDVFAMVRSASAMESLL